MLNEDTRDLRGMRDAVAAAERAAASGANLLLVGPPGGGKTMLARRIPGILPPLSEQACRWLAAEYEGCGLREVRAADRWSAIEDTRALPAWDPDCRPFRAPHHTVSEAGLCGLRQDLRLYRTPRGEQITVQGSCGQLQPERRVSWFRSGEVQLARFGVLLLDELPEFRASAIEALARAHRAMAVGAPLIVASALPCPCGWHGSAARECRCSVGARQSYSVRVERYASALGFDVRATLAPLTIADLAHGEPAESSAVIRKRVTANLSSAEVWLLEDEAVRP